MFSLTVTFRSATWRTLAAAFRGGCTIPEIKVQVLKVLSEDFHEWHSLCCIFTCQGQAMSSTVHFSRH